ncbi:MAG: hypothetical protein QXT14_08805 [Candidatus Bathyarchaeia archaeon]
MASTRRKYEIFATVETMDGFEVLMRVVEDGETVLMKSVKFPKRVSDDEMRMQLKKFMDETEAKLKPGERVKRMISLTPFEEREVSGVERGGG